MIGCKITALTETRDYVIVKQIFLQQLVLCEFGSGG